MSIVSVLKKMQGYKRSIFFSSFGIKNMGLKKTQLKVTVLNQRKNINQSTQGISHAIYTMDTVNQRLMYY